ncbi:hypothetical protein CCHL11_06658 [Colletotrichum chlorophyti]|uniref:Uncharacterized protein n=1 Tax=Colletotrichum chlorophyti TaxID=708187 RepID=A0A1Q8RXN9_9PEZI|nr:hypothetical protein CCHL11_06658 [Colletotrichum chlorophyti]
MRFSIFLLALSSGASALPALRSLSVRQPIALTSRKIEFKGAEVPAVLNDIGLSRVETEATEGDEHSDATKRGTEATNTANPGDEGGLHLEAIGDNKVDPTTGLTDSEAAEIVTGIDLKDKNAPGSINAKGQRNPLPGLNADETDAIVKQGQAALKEAGA